MCKSERGRSSFGTFHFIRVIIEHNSGFNEDQPGCVRDGDSQERDMAIQEIPFYSEVDR